MNFIKSDIRIVRKACCKNCGKIFFYRKFPSIKRVVCSRKCVYELRSKEAHKYIPKRKGGKLYMESSYDIVKQFEKAIAEYTGAKYAVAVDSCTNALFLCCKYLKVKKVRLPKYTYPGVACSIINAGGSIEFQKGNHWEGIYQLEPYGIYDCALRFKKDMAKAFGYYCLSFHSKKHIPIGRGGMILCHDLAAYKWFKRARFDGRGECPLAKEKDIKVCGYNMYLTPEQAARGLMLFETIKNQDLPDLKREKQGYADLSRFSAFKK